ncbi:esterase 1 [Mycena polygramma]|nr:esterase 1 [Mycena polygramma]
MKLQFSFLAPLAQIGTAPTIRLGNTTLVGLDNPTFKQDFFAGIPFAEPPLGDLRFELPVPKTLPPGLFNASAFGPACLQTASVIPDSMSEDCLTINILRPAGTPANAGLPVMFWTYGGGYNAGFSELYNASSMVAQSVARGTPVIHISFNYRLGPLGFPQGQEAEKRGALNLGFRDQIAALQWVQLHIEAFGGDKDKVTLFGQSAGAIMANLLFLTYPIKSLARAAIFESGSSASFPLFTPERREGTWEKFVSGVPSCASQATSNSTFGCLRAVNTTEIYEGMLTVEAGIELFPFQPVIDGPGGLIPDLPSVLLNRGQFARLTAFRPPPALFSHVLGTILVDPTVNSSAEIVASLLAQYSPSVSPLTLNESIRTVLKLYPNIPSLGSPFGTGNETFGLNSQYKRATAIQGDQWFESQRRVWMETAAQGGALAFGYLFTQPTVRGPPALGVAHDDEIPYVYGLPVDASPSAILLSQLMPNYWISFATSLTPNDGLGLQRPEWPQFTPSNKVLLQLNGANTTVIPDDYRKEQMAYMNSEPAIWHQ